MKKTKSLKIEYFRSVRKLWFFHIKASNHKIIAQSEGYGDKGECIHTASLFMNPDSIVLQPRGLRTDHPAPTPPKKKPASRPKKR